MSRSRNVATLRATFWIVVAIHALFAFSFAVECSAETQTNQSDQATGPIQPAALSPSTLPQPTTQADTAEQPTNRSTRVDKELPRVRFDVASVDAAELTKQILAAMTVQEKIGQLCQAYPGDQNLSDELVAQLRTGQVGSIFFCGNPELVRQAQEIAVKDSRLGIPLIVARDVIHGFRTIFPIPLGQAASWNPDLVREAAQVSAQESRGVGIHWTFAPMVDIARDPRWGRIAESLGEDPLLASALGAAMVRGFQSPSSTGELTGVAACAKHYAGYGLCEGGRDYNRVMASRNEMRNVYLPSFKACIDAGALSLMTAFNSINGVPATGHRRLVREILKEEWKFPGLVVSDWGTVSELIAHGYVADSKTAARAALQAGVDIEMVSTCYRDHLPELLTSDWHLQEMLDDAVRRVLLAKIRLGLFVQPQVDLSRSELLAESSRKIARQLGQQSIVMLKNDGLLPLKQSDLRRVAVIGPFAEARQDQLGCWTLDGKAEDTVTPLAALREILAEGVELRHVPCEDCKYNSDLQAFDEAIAAAKQADVALVFVGEEEALSGEAHSRVELSLPGSQRRLLQELGKLEVPVVLVVMAGRPLTIGKSLEQANAVLYVWHPGTMGGPAIADILLGVVSPSGKLPVTFPKSVGQVPLYYNHLITGRPSAPDYQAPPLSKVKEMPYDIRYGSHYVDADPFPLFPFGFGLSYTEFTYSDLQISPAALGQGETLQVSVQLTNSGETAGTEIVQLYVRDKVASVLRPIKELKGFRRISLQPGESSAVVFNIPFQALGFYNEDEQFVIESGDFQLWVGGSSQADLSANFQIQ